MDWVEKGQAPGRVTASARGPGKPAASTPNVPAELVARPHPAAVPLPAVSRYQGGGIERADSFACRHALVI